MRLIDADALIKELEKVYEYHMAEIKDANEHPDNYTSKFLPATAGAIDGLVDAEIVIADAPTIEPDGDTISRQAAIYELEHIMGDHPLQGYEDEQLLINALESLPSAQPDGDLISREDAIALVIKAIHGTDNKEIKEYLFDGLRKQMWSLPSAESTGAMDEAIQEYIKDGYMQPIGEDLVSRQDVIELVKKSYYDLSDGEEDMWAMVHDVEQLPSAPSAEAEQVTGKLNNPDDSLLTADSEACKEQKSKLDLISRRAAILAITGEPPEAHYPSWYAERIKSLPSVETPTVSEKHQLSEETSTNTSTDLISRQDVIAEFRDGRDVYDIMESIEELPSAPDSRQRGEWVEVEDYDGDVHYQCDQCGNEFILIDGTPKDNNYHFCPNCGARMYKGGEDE